MLWNPRKKCLMLHPEIEQQLMLVLKNVFKKDLKGTVVGINEQKDTKISGVPADQRLIGTDAHFKYVKSLVPGSDWGKQFINKYRKK